VEKSNGTLPAPNQDPRVLEVKGEWQEKSGNMVESSPESVPGLAGDSGNYASLYREFRNEGAAYPDRFEIPPGQRRLVLGYFHRLRGGGADDD
jgi:hypothetical protein